MSQESEDKKVALLTIKDFTARQMMAIALIRAGMDAPSVCHEAGLTRPQYNSVLKKYQEGNFDKLSTQVISNWENVIKSKMMNVSEKALNHIETLMEDGEMKDAKLAADIFATVFDKMRLSTGQSTENVSTVSQRITEMIESRTPLENPI